MVNAQQLLRAVVAAAAAVLVRVREVWERERVVVAGVAALAALALASKLAGPSRPPPATVGLKSTRGRLGAEWSDERVR